MKNKLITSDDMVFWAQMASTILGIINPIAGTILYATSTMVGMAKEDINELSKMPLQQYPPDKIAQAISDYNTAYNERIQQAKEAFNSIDENTVRLQEKWNNIQTLVDDNGYIIAPIFKKGLNEKINQFNEEFEDEIIKFSDDKIILLKDVDQYIKDLNQKEKKDLLDNTYEEASKAYEEIKEACILAYVEILDASEKFTSEIADFNELFDIGFIKISRKDIYSFPSSVEAINRMQQASQIYKSLEELLVSYLTAKNEYENLLTYDKEYDADTYNSAKTNADLEEIFTEAKRIYEERFKSVQQMQDEETKKRIEEENQRLAEERQKEQQKSVAQLNNEEQAQIFSESMITNKKQENQPTNDTPTPNVPTITPEINTQPMIDAVSTALEEIAAISGEYGTKSADNFVDNFVEKFGVRKEELTELFQEVTATVQSESARRSAAAYTNTIYNYSSENIPESSRNNSDINRLIEEINKPIYITLDKEVLGEAVISFGKQRGRMTRSNGGVI